MKKLLAASAVALTLCLTACAPGTIDKPSTSGTNGWVLMDDGRTVYCYFWDRGVSCDWENAR